MGLEKGMALKLGFGFKRRLVLDLEPRLNLGLEQGPQSVTSKPIPK